MPHPPLNNVFFGCWIKAEYFLPDKTSKSEGSMWSAERLLGPVKSIDGSVHHTEKGKIMERWRDHFNLLLNSRDQCRRWSSNIPQQPVRYHMHEPPTAEELDMAIKRAKCVKVGGPDGIPREVWKYGEAMLRNKLLHNI